MQSILLIAGGGALGAVSRHLVGRAVMQATGTGFPWGTFAVNVAGGLAMGLLIGFLAATDREGENAVRLAGAVGFLGGFTTFSAFSLELVLMFQRKAWGEAAAYAGGSVLLAALALVAGLWLMRRLYA